jgi:hypothetical protein
MHARDDRTPALVATVVVAMLVVLSGDATGIPLIIDVCEFAAAQYAAMHISSMRRKRVASELVEQRRRRIESELVELREAAPAVPAALVQFASLGDSPPAQVFTGLAVMYASLRAVEHLPPKAQGLYMRVAAVMLDGTLGEVEQAIAGADATGSESAMLSRMLEKYRHVMLVEPGVEDALACAATVHRFLARMPEREGRELDAEACGAAMKLVTSALHTVEGIAERSYGSQRYGS